MSTIKQAKRACWFKWIKRVVILLLLVLAIGFLTGAKFGKIVNALTPPPLAKVKVPEKQTWLSQNWEMDDSHQYHHKSQGTRTIPIPLSWFLALEQPKDSPWTVLWGEKGLFVDNDYLLRFGFIKGQQDQYNPYGLPIGFAVTPYQSINGVDSVESAVGFTCAACHTGHIRYAETDYVIEGGPAMTDLSLLTKALGAALGQTFASSKTPVLNGRFERFAQRVMKGAYTDAGKLALAEQLAAVIGRQAQIPSGIDVVEGFTRLDALNRIGNQVFALNPDRFENYVAINAPVNFPHLWTAPWFDWVQYDGSIMQPLIRNSGEAIGVQAALNYDAPHGEKRFSSSVPVKNLKWMEDFLSGDRPYQAKKFSGLLAPKWPSSFPKIDQQLAAKGQTIYQQHCQGCHLPVLDSPAIWSDAYFAPITYYREGKQYQTPEKLLKLNIVTQAQIGTDPAQASVLANRTVNISGNIKTGLQGMGLKTDICTVEPDLSGNTEQKRSKDSEIVQSYYSAAKPVRLVDVPFSDGPIVSFAFALGAMVQQVNDEWFKQNFIKLEDRAYFEGERPNCLQAPFGYKARPLNGIWATAPFLHNGSVASLAEMFKPAEQRAKYVQLGSVEFDAQRVGIKQDADLKVKPGQLYQQGLFILDTSLPGNSNAGHEFSNAYRPGVKWDQQPSGVIGPALSGRDQKAIVEYLKTL